MEGVSSRLAVSINPRVAKVITSLAPVVHVPAVLLPGTCESPGKIGHEEVLDSPDEHLEGYCLEVFLHRIPHLYVCRSASLILDLPASPHQA
jgi:hypothetical protein